MSKLLWTICCDNSDNKENLCAALTNLKYLTISASEDICSLIDENIDLFMEMIQSDSADVKQTAIELAVSLG